MESELLTKKRHLMPTPMKILEFHADNLIANYGKFWLGALYESGIIPHRRVKELYDVQRGVCFACGSEGVTQRCHIVPVCKGGSHGIDNLHLLCKECHLESEDMETAPLYWEWFKFKNMGNSGSKLRRVNTVLLYHKLYKEGKFDLLPDWVKEAMSSNGVK